MELLNTCIRMDQLNTSLTPVRFVDSRCVQSSPIKNDANYATCKARLETLVKDLQSNFAKWQLAQQRGTSVCYAIEAKKTRCLDKSKDDGCLYPDEMQALCDRLAVISSIFSDICTNTREILRQLHAVNKLAGNASNLIFYRTWKLQQFVSFTEELLHRYEQEAIVKRRVMQNIAHCSHRSELIANTTTWEFPDKVDAYVNLVFLLLAEEIRAK